MILAIDANIAVEASIAASGFAPLREYTVVAPALMWYEAHSALHERAWRRELTTQQALDARTTIDQAPISRIEDPRIQTEAWRFANEFGWAKVYDATYLALAYILGCKLLTVDSRLRRGTERLGFVVTPEEL